MRPSLGLVAPVRLSVQRLWFTWNRQAEESSNFAEIWPYTGIIVRTNLRLNVKVRGHWERKFKNSFACIASSNMDRFSQDQNDHRPILHISSNTFHQRKCFLNVIFGCLSVSLSHTSYTFVYSILERLRKFICYRILLLTLVNGEVTV